MKKYAVLFSVIVLIAIFGAFFVTGCSTDIAVLAEQNLSEKVETYFSGVGAFKVSISSGQREEPYKYDGISHDLTDFSIVTMFVNSDAQALDVEVEINSEKQNLRLEMNIVDGSFMGDLGKRVYDEDEISVLYGNESVKLKCKTKDFNIDADKAFEISVNAFKPNMQSFLSGKNLNAECYIRVLDNKEDNFERIFWYFYVYAQNGVSYYCIITVDTGDIIVKN